MNKQQKEISFWLKMFTFNNTWIAGTISIFINSPFFVMLVVFFAIFRAALQPYIDDAERKYYHRIDHRFLLYSEIYFHPKPSINISVLLPSQILISYVTILCMQSRDLSRDQLKRLHDQRKANILSNSPLLEYCRSFDAGLWLLHEKQYPSLVSMLEFQWANFPSGSIANIV